MKVTCPVCHQRVPVGDIDLSTGWARCRPCDELFQVPELAAVVAARSVGLDEDEPATVPERPFDAKITIDQNGEKLLLCVPAAGFFGPQLGLLLFSLFWLGFVTFWTGGALGIFFGDGLHLGNILFACFSIPFWLIGFGMFFGALWSAFGRRTLYLDPSVAVMRYQALVFRWTKRVSRDKIQKARRLAVKDLQASNGQTLAAADTSAELVYEGGAFKIPCRTSHERRWVVSTINQHLAEHPYDPRYFDASPGLSASPTAATFPGESRTPWTSANDRDPFGRRGAAHDDPRDWRKRDRF